MSRHWVIPDIHGCYKTMKTLVEDKIQPSGDDTITFLGDYVDRGPSSKRVIDYIMKLQKGPAKINCLRGNHEEYMIEVFEVDNIRPQLFSFKYKSKMKFWKSIGGGATLKSFGVKRARQISQKYINWLKSLDYYLVTENHVIVHAGLNFNIEDPFSDKEAMLILRDFEVDSEKIGGKVIIHGHVPLSLDFIKSTIENPESKYISLDNGCYRRSNPNMGNLLALEINTKELLIQRNIDLI